MSRPSLRSFVFGRPFNSLKTSGAALALAAASLGAPSLFAADPVDATIVSQNVVNKIDEKVYSHFLEHIYNSCNGGLWGELVWNRSLEAGTDQSWSWADGVIKQDSRANDRRLLLGAELQGDAPWTDYDIRVTAKKIDGSEGFLIMFRAAPDQSSYYWVNVGGWENKFIAIEKQTPATNGRRVIVGERKPFPAIENGRIYDFRVQVVGANIKVFMDQELVLEVADFADDAPKSGCVGVGTWGTRAEFGTVLVRDMNRKTLYDSTSEKPVALKNAKVDVRFWKVKGDAERKTGDARNSDKYVRFNGAGSISQPNFAFQKGETYDYSFWARGVGKAQFISAVVADGGSPFTLDAAQEFAVDAKDDWVKFSGEFKASMTSPGGSICLELAPNDGASLDVDQISVFPRSWAENSKGFRPDLLNAIKEIQPKLIRWPGGCYASAYRWKSGIGPQDDRVSYPLELWNDVDVNSFGLDEFITFCREVGAEPIMVVNVGTKQWTDAVGPSVNDVDWIQEAVDWFEYCNGPATSKWGAVRAKNGHPEPYGVKYWEIDNEVRGSDTPAQRYISIIKELVPRWKAIDPNVKIIACGSWMGDRDAWDSAILNGAGEYFDYLSTHRYDDPNGFVKNPWENQYFFESRRDMIAKSPNKAIKMFDSEWNAQSTDWRTGLHAGGILNCFERVGDTLEIAAPALFLRHVSADAWDNAFVNFDADQWFPAPNYVVMKLWRESYAPNRVELKSDVADMNGKTPVINAVATKSEDGKTLYFKAVNNRETDVEYRVALADAKAKAVKATVVSPEAADAKAKLRQRNDIGAADRIVPRSVEAKIVDGKIVVEAPSYSALVVEITVE